VAHICLYILAARGGGGVPYNGYKALWISLTCDIPTKEFHFVLKVIGAERSNIYIYMSLNAM
jgi:hypothetical protein